MEQKNNIPIFLASNDKYSPFVATTIASICYNTKSFIDFYILDSGISDFSKSQIEDLKKQFNNFSIEYLVIDLNKFEGFKTASYISLDTYSRFFIADLKPNLDKALYLDVDIIVLDDIKKLFEEKLDGKIIGGISETFYTSDNDSINKVKKNMDLSLDSEYFNAGVLLIDIKKWISNDIRNKLFETREKYKDKLTYADQDILNKVFENNFKALDSKYNFMNSYAIFDKKSEKKIIVRHFNGEHKPWNSTLGWTKTKVKHFEEFWFFAKMTSFYESLNREFLTKSILFDLNYKSKKTIKLFNFFPLLKIKNNNNVMRISLFSFIPLLKITK